MYCRNLALFIKRQQDGFSIGTHCKGRHAGWRRQEGYSRTPSAAHALDSNKRLSQCNTAIISAVLSGEMEGKKRDTARCREEPSRIQKIEKHVFFSF